MLRYIAVVVAMSLITGCVTDPYTGERKVSKAAVGAVVGAAVGAATSSKKDRGKGAAIGATVGAGAGYYMDVQERKLRELLQGTGVSVMREGNNIKLNMPGNITFNTGSANIQASFYPVLDSVSLVFKEFKKTSVRVTGHTDSVGSDSFNQTLSEQRAQSVVRYLASRDITLGRFQAVGYGERYPVASNATPEGRAMNRRVEIEIIPNE